MMNPTTQSLGPAGKHKRPTITQVYLWVINVWGGIKKNVIENSLKETGNANALDGNEDYVIFEDHEFDLERWSSDVKLGGNDSKAEQCNGFYDDLQ